MLRVRLLAGGLFLALLVVVVWLDLSVDRPYPGWLLLCTVCGVASCQELTVLLERMELRPFRRVLWPGVLLLIWVHWLPAAWELYYGDGSTLARWPTVLVALGGATVAALAVGMTGFDGTARSVRRSAGTVLGLLYLGGGATALVAARWLPQGLAAVMLLILATKAADSGAYFTGKLLGRRPLAPVLSPKKTLEGAVGAVLWGAAAAVLVAAVSGYWWQSWLPFGWGTLAALGALLGAWGQLGDLVESWLKRAAAVKDSSSWLPGLGGMLDVLDSLLWNAPPFALCWSLLQPA